MFFDRIGAKQAAKMSLRQAKPSAMQVTALYLLLTTGVSAVIAQFVANPFVQAAYDLIEWGYSVEEVIQYDLMGSGGDMGIYLGVALLLSVYESVVGVGFISYTLRLARNQQAGLGNLFDGFARLGRVLSFVLLQGVLELLWMCGAALPGMGMAFLLPLMGGDLMLAIDVGSMMAMAGVCAAVVWVSLRYALAAYYILDDPNCGGREAIRRSKTAMRGWKMELFALQFSFFGWLLLFGALGALIQYVLEWTILPFWVAALAGSMTRVWVLPYQGCAVANFYTAVKNWQPPQPPPWTGGYTGPYHYDRHSDGEGPAPF